jgi:hypothetical protein
MVTCKWFFKCKYHANGTFAKYKARLVAQGFFQVEDFDRGEFFSHFVEITSLYIFIALASIYDYHKHQFDVQTTFLHGHLDDEVFMQQPFGYVIVGHLRLRCVDS